MESGYLPGLPPRWFFRDFPVLTPAELNESASTAAASITFPAPQPSAPTTSIPSHSTERTVLAVVTNIIPASLVLLYLIWSWGPVRNFILSLPVISFFASWSRPWITFDDIIDSNQDVDAVQASLKAVQETAVNTTAANGNGKAPVRDRDGAASNNKPSLEAEADEATPLLASAGPAGPGAGCDDRSKLSWPPAHVTAGLLSVSLLHIGGLLAAFAYEAASGHLTLGSPLSQAFTDLVLGLAGWVYIAVRTAAVPQPTPSYDVFALLLVLLSGALVQLHLAATTLADGSALYMHPSALIGLSLASALLSVYGLVLEVSLPVYVYTPEVAKLLGLKDAKETLLAPILPGVDASTFDTPEMTVTLWQAISFSWVEALLQSSNKGKVEPEDVWRLSLDIKARVLDRKWKQLAGMKLLKRLWIINSRDMLIDLLLTVVSAITSYSKPLVLKRVLEGISAGPRASGERMGVQEVMTALVKGGEHTSREAAYVIAALGLVLVTIQSESDLCHLYACRRASVRTRSELMTAIFSKGMRCKDISGAVEAARGATESTGPTSTSSSDGKEAKQEADKKLAQAEETQNNQGVGKAVSLMSVGE